jgi:hypothetical protein
LKFRNSRVFFPQFFDVYNLANFIIKLAKLVMENKIKIPIVLVGKRKKLSLKEK